MYFKSENTKFRVRFFLLSFYINQKIVLSYSAAVWWRLWGVHCLAPKYAAAFRNSAQDQHIEYAWLSFHPAALIQYSQRGWCKKAFWHWPRCLLKAFKFFNYLGGKNVCKYENFVNYDLMYLATAIGKGQYISTPELKHQSKHRTEFPSISRSHVQNMLFVKPNKCSG